MPLGPAYRTAELVDGLVIAHDCGQAWKPDDALRLLREAYWATARQRDAIFTRLDRLSGSIDVVFDAADR
jgi:hypothetical protein